MEKICFDYSINFNGKITNYGGLSSNFPTNTKDIADIVMEHKYYIMALICRTLKIRRPDSIPMGHLTVMVSCGPVKKQLIDSNGTIPTSDSDVKSENTAGVGTTPAVFAHCRGREYNIFHMLQNVKKSIIYIQKRGVLYELCRQIERQVEPIDF